MNVRLIALISLLSCFQFRTIAQVADDFNNPQSLQNGFWKGDVNLFEISGGQLVSASQIANDTFFLSASSDSLFPSQVWELDLDLQFRTSSANYLDFVIAADSSDLIHAINALYVRIGNTQDEVSLYQRINGKDSLLIDGVDRSVDLARIEMTLQVKLDNGLLSVLRRFKGESAFTSEGSIALQFNSHWKNLGLRIRQSTSSFFGKHFFDRIYAGPPIRDTIAPTLINWTFSGESTLDLTFNENIEIPDTSQFRTIPAFTEPDIISVNGTGNSIQLQFREVFPENFQIELQITGIRDTSGNAMSDTSLQLLRVQTSEPQRQDLVISELMPIPSPSVGLPEFEYIEIYNRSNHWIDLGTLIVADPVSRRSVPSFILKPESFAVLYPEQAKEAVSGMPNVILVPSLPSLNNSGDNIMLRRASDDAWIDGVSYTSDWFGSDLKASGGWSLERRKLGIPCSLTENWTASVHPSGGTPGFKNSVDEQAFSLPVFQLLRYAPDTSWNFIRASFNRELDIRSLELNRWKTEPALVIDSISWDNDDHTTLRWYFNSDQLRKGVLYSIFSDTVFPCTGVFERVGFSFGLPSECEPGDLLISEVLFNEPTGGTEYIELYNASDSLLDLGSVRLFTRSGEGNALSSLIFNGNNARLLPPRSFVCISTNTAQVSAFYRLLFPGNMMQYQGSLDLSASEGYVLLYHNNGILLDSMYYSEDMHYPLLKDPDGVSLERLNYGSPAWQRDNWTSASELSGFGTPGYRNSQAAGANAAMGDMQLSTDILSPDGDGFDDIMAISFDLPSESRMTLRVYHLGGFVLRSLLENAYMGNETQVFFNGLTDQGKPLGAGMYVLMAEGFAQDGRIFRFKKAFSVAYR